MKRPVQKGMARLTKLGRLKQVGQYNDMTHKTRLVSADEIDYGKNGGLGRGMDRRYKVLLVKKGGDLRMSWEHTQEEAEQARRDVSEWMEMNGMEFPIPGNPTEHFLIQIRGEDCKELSRPIRKDIRAYYQTQACVSCGSRSNLVCDHKNDLYNDPRVLNLKTQTLKDFQSLCTHCNLQKRQVAKVTRESGKRYGATNIPSMKPWGIDFTQGVEDFDPQDPQAMYGTYWYDPVQFMKDVRTLSKVPCRYFSLP